MKEAVKPMFAPHKLRREQIQAIHDHVIVSDMTFDERITNGGILLLNDNGKGYGIRPRWGRVYAVGPEQQDVTVGQWILVEHGRWTRGLEIEDESGLRTIRKIDPACIMMVSDEEEMPKLEGVSTAVHIDKKS
jgi:co-chaperonin GroES (HSP10)